MSEEAHRHERNPARLGAATGRARGLGEALSRIRHGQGQKRQRPGRSSDAHSRRMGQPVQEAA